MNCGCTTCLTGEFQPSRTSPLVTSSTLIPRVGTTVIFSLPLSSTISSQPSCLPPCKANRFTDHGCGRFIFHIAAGKLPRRLAEAGGDAGENMLVARSFHDRTPLKEEQNGRSQKCSASHRIVPVRYKSKSNGVNKVSTCRILIGNCLSVQFCKLTL